MPGPNTPNLGLIVPTVGGDSGDWGNELNADLAILDELGVIAFYNESGNFSVPVPLVPEVYVRMTTGATNYSVTLPAPSACAGKVFVIKKVDSGIGSVSVVGTIDGQSSYLLTNQYQYVRVFSTGATYDVIGNN